MHTPTEKPALNNDALIQRSARRIRRRRIFRRIAIIIGIPVCCVACIVLLGMLRPQIFRKPMTPVEIRTSVSPVDGMTLVYVPQGYFIRGSTLIEASAFMNEKPAQQVYLDAFWIDQTEVTNAMYARCVDAGACQPPERFDSYTRDSYYDNPEYANYPVVNLKHPLSVAYCAWAGRRLPSEAEWEKAARGTDGRNYPWGNAIVDDTRANFNKIFGDTTPVGAFPLGASPYGALDMAGNVWEWVSDWYEDSYYQLAPTANPMNTGSDEIEEKYVLKGGAWNTEKEYTRPAARHSDYSFYANSNRGFRCAISSAGDSE